MVRCREIKKKDQEKNMRLNGDMSICFSFKLRGQKGHRKLCMYNLRKLIFKTILTT